MENEQGEKFKDQPHLGHCKKEKMLEKKKYDKQSSGKKLLVYCVCGKQRGKF